MAEAAARAGVRHFVFVSSIRAQSGPAADHALTERDAAAPTEAYGRSKLAAEAAVQASGVPFTILRPVPVYGPGVGGYFALLMRAARSPWPLPLKDFVSRRSLLGLDNFVSALAFVLERPPAGETYLVADPGVPLRLADVAATLRQARGRWPLIVPFPTQYLELPLRLMRRADIWERLGGNLRVDAGKLIAAGWQPPHDTRQRPHRAGTRGRAARQVTTPRRDVTAQRPRRYLRCLAIPRSQIAEPCRKAIRPLRIFRTSIIYRFPLRNRDKPRGA